MEKDLSEFYLSQSEPNKSCLLALRDLLVTYPALSETRKYGMPCFVIDKKPLCYLWTSKKDIRPYLLFVDGNLIDHPALLQEKRTKMKVFYVDAMKDLPLDTIDALMKEAIEVKRS